MCIFSSVCSGKIQRADLAILVPSNGWPAFTYPWDLFAFSFISQMPVSQHFIQDGPRIQFLTDRTDKVADKSSI